MGNIIKTIIVFAVVIAVVGMLGLVVMSGLARFDGVHEVPVPAHSFLAELADDADYSDAWRAEMEFSAFADINQVADAAFRKGKELKRSDKEVVFSGRSLGLRFEISYTLERTSNPPALIVSTVVHTESRLGTAYWTVARPVHRMLLPFMVNRMARTES